VTVKGEQVMIRTLKLRVMENCFLKQVDDFIRRFNPRVFCANANGGETVTKKKKKKVSVKAVNPKVTIETTKGTITVELYSDVPNTTKNFVGLVSSGFYNGITFHRYVENFVIQGGDPQGTGGGGADKTISLEINPKRKHVKGALGMARTADPNSASSQYYICLADVPNLDGSYAVFGQVVEGMENVMQLRQGDKMTKVTLRETGNSK
jgi:peptidyl-prolyl cis-trans isomerase B (cyclophilin B)